ncbi:MAG: hypothetical protein D6732_28090 [Methanobacteriota archaeon]|nr:MAG: hypothetical protein D6732_28090 [Euryarchaeota archaeon]
MADQFSLDSIIPEMMGKTFGLYADITYTRDFLIRDFILNGLEDNGVICIVTLTQGANKVIDELSSISDDAAMIVNEAILNERLQIVDMYSFRSGIPEEIAPGTYYLETASDLTSLSIQLNKISSIFDKLRIVINPLSLLAVYAPSGSLLNFLQTLSARVTKRNQTCLLILDSGVIEPVELSKIESVLDGMIELQRDESLGKFGEKFRIKFMRGLRDTPYFDWTLVA